MLSLSLFLTLFLAASGVDYAAVENPPAIQSINLFLPECPLRDSQACRPQATISRLLESGGINCGHRFSDLLRQPTDREREAEGASFRCVTKAIAEGTPFYFIDQHSGTESPPSKALLLNESGRLLVLTHDATPGGRHCAEDLTELRTCEPVDGGPALEASLFGFCRPGTVLRTICRGGYLIDG